MLVLFWEWIAGDYPKFDEIVALPNSKSSLKLCKKISSGMYMRLAFAVPRTGNRDSLGG
jgi:ABC-type polysaccharide/polyol phosphate transport system ATPase subunit